MARFNGLRNGFALGEVSPAARARADAKDYSQMCEELTNFIPQIEGGVIRRKGSEFIVNETSISTVSSSFNWFEYKHANGESYKIVITDGIARAYRPSTNVWYTIAGSGGTYATDYTFFHTTIVATDIVRYGQSAQFGDLLFITNGLCEPICIYALTDTSFDMFRTTRYSLEGADGIGARALTNIQLHRNVPFLDENLGAITITPSAASGTITLTASAALFTSDMAEATVSASKKIMGSYFRLRIGGAVGIAHVTGFTSSTIVTAVVYSTLPGFPGPTAISAWSESAWSRRRGFPRSVTFKDQRIIWGGSEAFPDTIWASQLNDIWEVARADMSATAPVKGADACFNATLSDASRSKINFLASEFDLYVGSETRETTVSEQDPAFALGVLNIRNKPQTKIGSAYLPCLQYESAVTAVDKSRSGIKESVFDFKLNSYQAQNLMTLASHFFKRSNSNRVALGFAATYKNEWIQKIAYQTSEQILWVVAGYNLYSCRRSRQDSTLAWSQHILGGSCARSSAGFPSATATIADPVVTDIISIIGSDYNRTDHVYIRVVRDVNGVAKNFIERITKPGTGDMLSVMGDHLDCSVSATDVAKTSWVAIATHLASSTVHVVADGIYIGTKALSAAGTLTLTVAATEVWVGLHADSVLVPVQLENNSLFGSGIGPIKRVEEVTVIWDRTVNALVGMQSNEDNMTRINFRTMADEAGDPTPLFSGQHEPYKFTSDYETKANIMIKQDRPLPMTVLAIVASGVLYD